jgi:cobalt-zinc-cadmium efflux system protein
VHPALLATRLLQGIERTTGASRVAPTYPGLVTQSRRLSWALFLNAGIVVAQVAAGAIAHSVGLISDAAHNLADVGAVALALFAVKTARRRPNARRSFGYHRAPILAAQANAAALLVATGLLAVEGFRRLLDPSEVRGGVVLIVALVALVGNLVAAKVVHGQSQRDLNMRSAYLHLIGDAATSAGAAVAGGVILLTDGTYWIDPAVSLIIGALIGYRAVGLLREANGVLLEGVPTEIDLDEVRATMVSVPGVEAVHDLHAWSLSSDLAALSAHVVLGGQPSLAEAQRVTALIKTELTEHHGIAHATLELEGDDCVEPGVDPCAAEQFTAPVSAHHGHHH